SACGTTSRAARARASAARISGRAASESLMRESSTGSACATEAASDTRTIGPARMLLDDDRPRDHVHAAGVAELAVLLRREVDRDGLVERQRLVDAEILDDDLLGAGAIGLARDDEAERLAGLRLDLGGLEAVGGDGDGDGSRLGGLGGRGGAACSTEAGKGD